MLATSNLLTSNPRCLVAIGILVALFFATACTASAPPQGDIYLREATIARDQGELDEAREKAVLAIEDGRREREARELLAAILRHQARTHQAEGDYELAARTFFDGADVEPSRARKESDIRVGLDAARQASVSGTELLSIIERALLNLPDDLELHREAAQLAEDAGELDAAISHYRWLVSAEPDNSHAALRLGITFLAADRPQEAASLLRRVYTAESDNIQAALNLISALQRLSRDSEIREIFDELVTNFPGQPFVLFRYADFEEAQGNQGQAHQLRHQAHQASPAIEEREPMRPLQ